MTTTASQLIKYLLIYIVIYNILSPLLINITSHNNGIILITGCTSKNEHSIGFNAAYSISILYPDIVILCAGRSSKDVDDFNNNKYEHKYPSNIIPIVMDVTNNDHLLQTIQKIQSYDNKPLIGLINNAAIAPYGALETVTQQDYENAMKVNFFAPIRIIRKLLPLMRQAPNGGARIIEVSSYSAVDCPAFLNTYCSSKAAMEASLDGLRKEMGSYGIYGSILRPAFVKSKLSHAAYDAYLGSYDKIQDVELQKLYSGQTFGITDFIWRVGGATGAEASSSTTPAILHALFSQHPKLTYTVGNVPVPFLEIGMPIFFIQIVQAIIPKELNYLVNVVGWWF